MRRSVAVMILTVVFIFGLGAASASAVPLHQHQLTTPNGKQVLVADGFCQVPEIFGEGGHGHKALHNFHQHVHLGNPPVGLAFFC